jgi:subtilisin family serine protease
VGRDHGQHPAVLPSESATEIQVKKLFKPFVVSAVWLLASFGGGTSGVWSEEPATGPAVRRSERASNAHRVALPGAVAAPRIDPRLRTARGPVDVWVALDQNSVAAQRAALAEAAGITDRIQARTSAGLKASARAHRQRIRQMQAGVAGHLASLGGQEIARVQTAHNAIAVRIDASQLTRVAALSGVGRVRPVIHYELALSGTVPYVGAAAVQAGGRDGTGVTVAVLDSGIDYTHRNLGGPGTLEAYAAAWGADEADPRNTTLDGLFPTDKVVGGYDFVGETWGSVGGFEVGVVTEDPDPIDRQGHGTHVADIIAGKSLDGLHKGVAPGAKLLAVKVCSAISSSCNGVALIKGMDFALDPDGDGDTDDAVDIINLSLGASYGQPEDDLSAAAANAVRLGVVVVVSAGNSGNLPYVVGSPSNAPGVISVAQTQVPSAAVLPLVVNTPAAIAGVYANTATVDWAPVGNGVTGDVAWVGSGCPGDAYLADPAGKIALVDRGTCAVSLKVDRAATAGATGVLIGLVAAGDATSFSLGGGTMFVPTLVIQQSLSIAIRTQLIAGEVVNVSISPAASIGLVGGIVRTSSRGPSIDGQTIKPEIGAPGASVSAEVGTGTGETAFGGTSGAAPMVAGAAALLLEAFPHRSPAQIKAMLMNSAETVVYTDPAQRPGELAPITRIGAGELRVDRALGLHVVAHNRETRSAALSFGAREVSERMVLEKTLRVENLSNTEKRFTVTPTFRYADDQASGAVTVVVKPVLRLGRREKEDLAVKLIIDPTRLPAWTLDGGSQGGNGAALNGPEYDGYITLTAGSEKLSIPWHVLPRKAAETSTDLVRHRHSGPMLTLRNRGLDAGDYEIFSLTGVSRKIPRRELPGPGDDFAVIDMRSVGVRFLPDALTGLGADVLEFAINTTGRRATPNYPAEFDVLVDVDGDGVEDYLVFNEELGGFAASGQNAVSVGDLRTGGAAGFFFTDADLNSGNVILTVLLNSGPGSITLAPGATIGFSVYAVDNYFSGDVTDAIEGMRFTPGVARFGVVGAPFGTVDARGRATLGVSTATVPDSQSSELGLLLMYRRNAGREAEALRIR